MAVNQRQPREQERGAPAPVWPDRHPSDVILAYDPWPLDTLHVLFDEEPRPGSYVPVAAGDLPADGLSVKVAMDGSAVVGLMIEGYLADGVSRPPAWMAVAPFAGIAPETLAAFGLAPRDDGLGRDAAVSSFLPEVRAVWAATGRAEAGLAPAHG